MCISSQFFLAPALPGRCGRFLLIILRIFHEVLINHCGCIQFLIANLIVQKYEVLCLKLSVYGKKFANTFVGMSYTIGGYKLDFSLGSV